MRQQKYESVLAYRRINRQKIIEQARALKTNSKKGEDVAKKNQHIISKVIEERCVGFCSLNQNRLCE